MAVTIKGDTLEIRETKDGRLAFVWGDRQVTITMSREDAHAFADALCSVLEELG